MFILPFVMKTALPNSVKRTAPLTAKAGDGARTHDNHVGNVAYSELADIHAYNVAVTRGESIGAMQLPNQEGESGSTPTSPLYFHLGKIDDAASLVKQFHYSRRLPSSVQMVGTMHTAGGLFGECGEAVAACFFSIPPTRWGVPVWELSRLVRRDDACIRLTKLVGMMVKAARKSGGINLLVSFADFTQGHHGGIYQAASWAFSGIREKAMDGLIINGAFVPGRTCNSIYGTRSPDRLKTMKPSWDIQPHFDDGKALYWKALDEIGEQQAKKLGLKREAYPKPKGGGHAAS